MKRHVLLRLKELSRARRQGLYYTAKRIERAVERGDKVRGRRRKARP